MSLSRGCNLNFLNLENQMNAIAPNKVPFLDSTREQRREVIYRCASDLLRALLQDAHDSEKQTLFQALEYLGIAEIRNLNASADSLHSSGTGTVHPHTNQDFQNHGTTARTNAQAAGVDGLSQPASNHTFDI
jgi:hypothetical protein